MNFAAVYENFCTKLYPFSEFLSVKIACSENVFISFNIFFMIIIISFAIMKPKTKKKSKRYRQYINVWQGYRNS